MTLRTTFRGGLNVVAVEADPALCSAARRKFAVEEGTGRLVVENLGIASEDGEMEFWVSDHSVWSSFSRENATKASTHATPIMVPTTRFGHLIDKYGVPYFLKVDIEGNDRLCLEDLANFERPPFLSVELSHEDGIIDIELLANLGYSAFRCVRQNDYLQIRPDNLRQERFVRQVLSHLGPAAEPVRRLGHRRLKVRGWRFPYGSSGPLPWDLTGRWISREELAMVWHGLHNADLELGARGLGEWFDIHASLDPSGRTS